MREKMKGMSLIQKIDYLWTYYKIWLLVPVCIGIVTYIGVSAYKAKQENILVSGVIIGSSIQDSKELEQDVKSYMGKDGKNDVVTMQTNIPDDHMGQTSVISLTTLFGAEAVDVLVCPFDVYEHYSGQEGLKDLKNMQDELSGESEKAELTGKGDAFVIRDSQRLKEKLGVAYEEVYISIVENGKHMEGAEAFVQYVLENI